MFQRYIHQSPIKKTITLQDIQLPAELVITNNDKLQVTIHDVLCLANYTYLNDIIINYMLQEHHKEAANPNIYLFDSLFHTTQI